mmetsp:Transcript_6051/g.12748  ORF Transcript_6051/g.12748 Transcript_6051/m.12748 type:complete len:258 (-) Transcript_6051:106-879(-)|eukprot:CAMPEP_0172461276 /NCGR_PEP_ID=MMETSP1065-20121228/39879_1 /TAXON_ID=265537 /ORGANISM="Amphiprora paludosa, Strain CCMP125" /LENGTH=257 /DNA_ID=CAMNT_0013216537 /DNA_START=379 /DNA_END=1152 /DNA_ORIENTATION=+
MASAVLADSISSLPPVKEGEYDVIVPYDKKKGFGFLWMDATCSLAKKKNAKYAFSSYIPLKDGTQGPAQLANLFRNKGDLILYQDGESITPGSFSRSVSSNRGFIQYRIYDIKHVPSFAEQQKQLQTLLHYHNKRYAALEKESNDHKAKYVALDEESKQHKAAFQEKKALAKACAEETEKLQKELKSLTLNQANALEEEARKLRTIDLTGSGSSGDMPILGASSITPTMKQERQEEGGSDYANGGSSSTKRPRVSTG